MLYPRLLRCSTSGWNFSVSKLALPSDDEMRKFLVQSNHNIRNPKGQTYLVQYSLFYLEEERNKGIVYSSHPDAICLRKPWQWMNGRARVRTQTYLLALCAMASSLLFSSFVSFIPPLEIHSLSKVALGWPPVLVADSGKTQNESLIRRSSVLQYSQDRSQKTDLSKESRLVIRPAIQ